MGSVRLALTQSANVLGLSPVIVGFALARTLGGGPAASSILLGGLLTGLLAALSAAMAATYQEPTARLSRRFFGPLGPRLVGGALAVALAGWFGVHALALVQAVGPLVGAGDTAASMGQPGYGLLLLGGALVSLAVVWQGNERVASINAVQAPILTLVVVLAALAEGGGAIATAAVARPHGPSVLMVLAAGLGDIVDMPAIMHRATSRQAAIFAALMTYAIVVPLLLLCGVALAAHPSAHSAIDAIGAIGSGNGALRLLVVLLATSSAALGNAGLLYAGGLSLAAAFNRPAVPRWRVAQAALALSISLSPIAHRLDRLLDALGLASGAIGSALLTAYVLRPPPLQAASDTTLLRLQAGAALLAALAGALWFGLRPGEAGLAVAVSCVGAAGLCGAAGPLAAALRRPRARTG